MSNVAATADIHITRARSARDYYRGFGPATIKQYRGVVRLRGPRGGKGSQVVYSVLPSMLIDGVLRSCTLWCAANGVELGNVTYGKDCGASVPWDSEGNLV